MTYQLSPGITSKEIDKTSGIPAIPTTVAGFVGDFRWGPAEEIVSVSSESELVSKFGKPTNTKYLDFLIASQFLLYGKNLKLVRALDSTTAKNATAEATTGSGTTGTGLLIKNSGVYNLSYLAGEGNVGPWAAKFPGIMGNGLKVSMADNASYKQSMTVTTVGTALTGTGFTTKLIPGSKIYDPSSGETRSVVTVTDNTNAVINAAFTANLTSVAVDVYWKYYDLFQLAPNSSVFAQNAGTGAKDELHVVVIDGSGLFSGTVGTVLEKYAFVSKATDAKLDTGAVNYYKSVINSLSSYIYWMDHVSGPTNWGTTIAAQATFDTIAKPAEFTLAGGVEGTTVVGNYLTGYDKFLEPEADDVAFLITGSANAAKANYVSALAASTLFKMAVISPESSDVVNAPGAERANVIEYRNTLTNTSYAVFDSGWKLAYDKYNDAYRWLPLNADIAGVMVNSDNLRAPWISPAGYVRGQIRNCVKLAYNPNESDRDALYPLGINPVVTFAGDGTLLFGDKTMLNRPSAFGSIGVRRMFSIVEKQISLAAKSFLFEQNTPSERSRFKNVIDSYLRTIQSQQGLEDWRCVIDETNNTADIISAFTLVGDIYIKPIYSINYIKLNFVAVRTGVDFSEVIQNFA